MYRHFITILAGILLLSGTAAVVRGAPAIGGSGRAGNSVDSVRAVRSFYAGLNQYLATGDLDEVEPMLENGSLSEAPSAGATGNDSGIESYLLALRSSYSTLHFDIQDLEPAGGSVMARVHAVGTPNGGASVLTADQSRDEWDSSEFFKVRDGKVAGHWSEGRVGPLYHTIWQTPPSVRVNRAGKLAFAELTFWPGKQDFASIPGPGVVTVTKGTLTLVGSGMAEVVVPRTGESEVSEPQARIAVSEGSIIFIPRGHAVVRNETSENVTVRVAVVASEPIPYQTSEHDRAYETDGTGSMVQALLRAPGFVETMGNVVVNPLAASHDPIAAGSWNFEFGWLIIGPGESVELAQANAALETVTVTGTVNQAETDGPDTPTELQNAGDEPALMLVATLDQVS
jgi:hypothetical protein